MQCSHHFYRITLHILTNIHSQLLPVERASPSTADVDTTHDPQPPPPNSLPPQIDIGRYYAIHVKRIT